MISVSCLRTAEEQEMVREKDSEEIANEKGRARRTETK